jgi:hypothetical protein
MRTFERLFLMIGTALVGASLGAGCGGGDDDSDADLSTGLAQSKLLSDVTPAEASQACERLQSGIDSRLSQDKLARAVCTIVGAAVAETPSECESLRDDCIEQSDQQGTEEMMGLDFGKVELECSASSADLQACTGTVGQLETCFNDTLDKFDALLGSITCADAASVEMDDIEGFGEEAGGEPPASCAAVDCGEGSPFGG